MSDPIIVTRDKVRREWSDFEPKLVAALLSGGGTAVATAVLTPIAKRFGFELSPELVEFAPLVIAGFIGWLTPSMGTTVTKKVEGNGRTSETHSGNPVTTITQPTKIIATGTPVNPSFTKLIEDPDVQATEVLSTGDVPGTVGAGSTAIPPTPQYARAASILNQLGRSSGSSAPLTDDH